MEKEHDYVIDARTPEMIKRIEKEKPLLRQMLNNIKERAFELFESTGDIKSALEEAVDEEIKEYEKKEE